MKRENRNTEKELRELMIRALAGDEVAYEQFLNQVSQVLRSFFMKIMSYQQWSTEKAEDLVQEVLISIHRKRDLYRPEMPLLPWVHGIARYRLIDSLRAEKRRPGFVEWTEAVEACDLQCFVEPMVESGADLLEGLTEQQKKVLTLAKVDELSSAQIAEQLGMSLSSVKVTVHRSLKAIRKNLLNR